MRRTSSSRPSRVRVIRDMRNPPQHIPPVTHGGAGRIPVLSLSLAKSRSASSRNPRVGSLLDALNVAKRASFLVTRDTGGKPTGPRHPLRQHGYAGSARFAGEPLVPPRAPSFRAEARSARFRSRRRARWFARLLSFCSLPPGRARLGRRVRSGSREVGSCFF
jgi:hypothetical protein